MMTSAYGQEKFRLLRRRRRPIAPAFSLEEICRIEPLPIPGRRGDVALQTGEQLGLGRSFGECATVFGGGGELVDLVRVRTKPIFKITGVAARARVGERSELCSLV